MIDEKTYVYKIFRNDVFLGVLPNVQSDFGFSQDINTAGSSMTIVVGIDIDVASEPVEAILDETGAEILDESDEAILEEKRPEVFGNSNDQILLRNGNLVEVWEYSSYYPNGKKMFNGLINKLEGTFGSENSEETVSALVYSRGSELDNFIIQDGL